MVVATTLIFVAFIVLKRDHGVHGWECEIRPPFDRDEDDPRDRRELETFARATHVESWTDGSRDWLNENKSMCSWEGICCNRFNDSLMRVTEIHVERNGLNGSFPETFTSMRELRVVNVHLNNMTNFPPHVERLTHLREAKFGRNPICGTVPMGFARLRNLTKFNCNFCCLSGVFPGKVLSNKPLLEETFWDGNNFTGYLPSQLVGLRSLTKVSFNLNSMSGNVPQGLCELPKLRDCRIGSDTNYTPYDLSSERKFKRARSLLK